MEMSKLQILWLGQKSNWHRAPNTAGGLSGTFCISIQIHLHSEIIRKVKRFSIRKCIETPKKAKSLSELGDPTWPPMVPWKWQGKSNWIQEVSGNRNTTTSFVTQIRHTQGAPNDLEYGRGGHWIQKVSRNRKTTKSFVMQKRHPQGAPNNLLDV